MTDEKKKKILILDDSDDESETSFDFDLLNNKSSTRAASAATTTKTTKNNNRNNKSAARGRSKTKRKKNGIQTNDNDPPYPGREIANDTNNSSMLGESLEVELFDLLDINNNGDQKPVSSRSNKGKRNRKDDKRGNDEEDEKPQSKRKEVTTSIIKAEDENNIFGEMIPFQIEVNLVDNEDMQQDFSDDDGYIPNTATDAVAATASASSKPAVELSKTKVARERMRALEKQYGLTSSQPPPLPPSTTTDSTTEKMKELGFLSKPSPTGKKTSAQPTGTEKKPFSLGFRPSERKNNYDDPFVELASSHQNSPKRPRGNRSASLTPPSSQKDLVRSTSSPRKSSDDPFADFPISSNKNSPKKPRSFTNRQASLTPPSSRRDLRHTDHIPSRPTGFTRQPSFQNRTGMKNSNKAQSFRMPKNHPEKEGLRNTIHTSSTSFGRQQSFTQRPDFKRSQSFRPPPHNASFRSSNRPGRGNGLTESRHRTSSVPSFQRQNSSRPGMPRSSSMPRNASQRSLNLGQKRQKSVRKKNLKSSKSGKNIKTIEQKQRERIELPHKSITLVWAVVAAELCFDLSTTIIAFNALQVEGDCCGYEIRLGPVPMTVTWPFFLLVICELALLIRAIILTLCPNTFHFGETSLYKKLSSRNCFWKWFCCCLRWKVKIVMAVLGFLVLLNPFFGCVIAWMLMYQSDKDEAFIVLGLEGASLMLHFISVWIEGTVKNCRTFLIQMIPLVPFLASIGLTSFYLKQGGICYSVEKQLFSFQGCEVCEDGLPPWEDQCWWPNGTAYPMKTTNIFSLDNLNDLDSLTMRTEQTEYCEIEYGPPVNFCFFAYE